MADGTVFDGISDLKNFPRIWNPYAFENPNVQKFIHSTGLHFDLIINEEFFGDSFLMFAHKFKAPIVTICKFNRYCDNERNINDFILQGPFGSPDFVDRQQGLLTPLSIVPHWV